MTSPTTPSTPDISQDSGHDISPDLSSGEITVYWRPGCPFCGSLFRQLDHAQLPHRRVNIWDDESGAAMVRSIARGNETVPTVTVGDPSAGGVGLVNPNVAQILAAAGHR